MYWLVKVEGVEDVGKVMISVLMNLMVKKSTMGLEQCGRRGRSMGMLMEPIGVHDRLITIIAYNCRTLTPAMQAHENVGNVIVNGNRLGCSYNEFLACNPKEYDEFCPSHEMQKLDSELWNHAMVEDGHVAYTDRYMYGLALQIREMVAATEPKTMKKVVHISGVLTDEAVRNGSIKKVEKRGNVGKPTRIRMVGMPIRGLGLGMFLLLL
ncbi:hypothetical protein Tco_0286391 [Tanacetum coccineum]